MACPSLHKRTSSLPLGEVTNTECNAEATAVRRSQSWPLDSQHGASPREPCEPSHESDADESDAGPPEDLPNPPNRAIGVVRLDNPSVTTLTQQHTPTNAYVNSPTSGFSSPNLVYAHHAAPARAIKAHSPMTRFALNPNAPPFCGGAGRVMVNTPYPAACCQLPPHVVEAHQHQLAANPASVPNLASPPAGRCSFPASSHMPPTYATYTSCVQPNNPTQPCQPTPIAPWASASLHPLPTSPPPPPCPLMRANDLARPGPVRYANNPYAPLPSSPKTGAPLEEVFRLAQTPADLSDTYDGRVRAAQLTSVNSKIAHYPVTTTTTTTTTGTQGLARSCQPLEPESTPLCIDPTPSAVQSASLPQPTPDVSAPRARQIAPSARLSKPPPQQFECRPGLAEISLGLQKHNTACRSDRLDKFSTTAASPSVARANRDDSSPSSDRELLPQVHPQGKQPLIVSVKSVTTSTKSAPTRRRHRPPDQDYPHSRSTQMQAEGQGRDSVSGLNSTSAAKTPAKPAAGLVPSKTNPTRRGQRNPNPGPAVVIPRHDPRYRQLAGVLQNEFGRHPRLLQGGSIARETVENKVRTLDLYTSLCNDYGDGCFKVEDIPGLVFFDEGIGGIRKRRVRLPGSDNYAAVDYAAALVDEKRKRRLKICLNQFLLHQSPDKRSVDNFMDYLRFLEARRFLDMVPKRGDLVRIIRDFPGFAVNEQTFEIQPPPNPYI